MGSSAKPSLQPALDSLYRDYNREESASDPVHRVRPFDDPRDREVAGFCAAALAFGRVASVLNTIDTLFEIMGPRPAEYVRAFDPERRDARLRAMVHRWTRGDDIAALLWILRQMIEESGSIESFFLAGDVPGAPGRRPRARQLLDASAWRWTSVASTAGFPSAPACAISFRGRRRAARASA